VVDEVIYQVIPPVTYRVIVYSYTLSEQLAESQVNQPFDAKRCPLWRQTRP